MTYLQFFLWLTGTYSIYYLINILWDWSKNQSPADTSQLHELTFIDQHTAQKVIQSPPRASSQLVPEPVGEPVSIGLGGVSMIGLFELARTEAINLTASVSF